MGKKRKHKKKKMNGGIKYPQAKASAVSSTYKRKPSKPKFQLTVSNIKEFKPVGSGQKKPAGRKVTRRNLPKSKLEAFFVQLANDMKEAWSRFQKLSPLKKITIIFSSSLVLLLLGSIPDLWQIYLTYNPPFSATEQVADDTTTESTAFSAGEESESTTDASSATATTDPPVSTTEMPTTTRRAMPIIADAWLEEIDDKEFMTVNKNEWFKISCKYTGDASLIKWIPVDDEKDGVKKISDDEWVAICHSAGDAILVCEVNGEPKKAIFVKAIVPVKRIHVEGFSLSIGETRTALHPIALNRQSSRLPSQGAVRR